MTDDERGREPWLTVFEAPMLLMLLGPVVLLFWFLLR